MSLFEDIKRDASGVQTLIDWLGEGGEPVSPAWAAHRAVVCIAGNNGDRCPHNRAAKWWERFFKDPIAEEIRKQLEIKNRVNISTPHDDKLHMCDRCGCCLPLKVHVPINHVVAHTTPEQFAAMPEYCWQRREAETI